MGGTVRSYYSKKRRPHILPKWEQFYSYSAKATEGSTVIAAGVFSCPGAQREVTPVT